MRYALTLVLFLAGCAQYQDHALEPLAPPCHSKSKKRPAHCFAPVKPVVTITDVREEGVLPSVTVFYSGTASGGTITQMWRSVDGGPDKDISITPGTNVNWSFNETYETAGDPTVRVFARNDAHQVSEAAVRTVRIREPGWSEDSYVIDGYVPWYRMTGMDSYEANEGRMTGVTFAWYEFDTSGNVLPQSNHTQATQANVDAMKALGIRVKALINNNQPGGTPFSAPHFRTVMNDSTARANLINSIVNTTVGLGLDGVDVDFERLQAQDETLFTNFVTDLTAAMHAQGKTVAVVVYGVTANTRPAYNLLDLAAVADELRPMVFGNAWSGDAGSPRAGAAPMSYVNNVINYFLNTVGVPADKLVFSLPIFGLDFNSSGVASERQWGQIMDTWAAQGQPTITHDTTEQVKHFAYGGNDVYFDDAGTLAAKAQVIKDAGIKGVTFWYVGGVGNAHREDPAMWDAIHNVMSQ